MKALVLVLFLASCGGEVSVRQDNTIPLGGEARAHQGWIDYCNRNPAREECR